VNIGKTGVFAGGVLGLGLIAILAFAVVSNRAVPRGIEVLGDHAPSVRAALGVPVPEQSDRIGVRFVLVDDWLKMNYLPPDIRPLCGTACAGDAWLVRALSLRVGGAQKTVFIRISPWQDTPLAPPQTACLGQIMQAELLGMSQQLPDCAAALAQPVTRYVLPFGLGAL
jgi:hypothetical protein